jgi:lipoprotein-releasing system permease protein
VIFIVLLLLVVAASVAIANSQFIQIVSQQEQIAVLSAIGFTSRQVLLTFIIEGFVIALVGSLSGLIIAVAVISYLGNCPVNLPMDVYQVDAIPVELRNRDIIITFLSAIAMVCISSIVPASYASRLDPVEVLRRS